MLKSAVLALALSSASGFTMQMAAKPAAKPAAASKVVAKAAAPVKKAAPAPVKKAAIPLKKAAPKAVAKASPQGAYGDALGAQAPLGFYDPFGLVTNVDQVRFDRLRTVELKHGRIAMLAFLGHVVTSNGIHFPGYLSKSADLLFSDVKPGLAAFDNLPALATLQIVLFVGVLEAFVMRDVTGASEFPGDYRNGFDFGWDKFDEQTK